MKSQRTVFYRLIIITGFIVLCVSCEWDDLRKFNEGMKNVSGTIRKIDTIGEKFSEGASKFAKHVERYVDTTEYRKNSTGQWKKK